LTTALLHRRGVASIVRILVLSYLPRGLPILVLECPCKVIATQKSKLRSDVGNATRFAGIRQNGSDSLQPTALDVVKHASFLFEQSEKRSAGHADDIAGRIDVQRAGI